MLGVETVGIGRHFSASSGLRKKRGPLIEALQDVSLAVEAGEVHGLLGPNGAGKTTLCKILSTVLLPTSGTARVMGHDVVTETALVRRLVGIVFGGERGLYTRLTARQNLRYWAALYRLPSSEGNHRAEELLERFGLTDRADSHVETFSRGMKQRLHLARGLIADPPVLLLDEATTGMDPVAAREFRAVVDELRAEGRTILLTTHDMVEAEAVCDRVTLVDRGCVLATESPRTLGRWLSRFERIDANGVDEALLAAVATVDGVGSATRRADGSARIEITADGAAAVVLARLVAAGVTSVRTSVPSLEEVYLQVIGERGLEV